MMRSGPECLVGFADWMAGVLGKPVTVEVVDTPAPMPAQPAEMPHTTLEPAAKTAPPLRANLARWFGPSAAGCRILDELPPDLPTLDDLPGTAMALRRALPAPAHRRGVGLRALPGWDEASALGLHCRHPC